jgi:hypothetical protein
MTSFPYENLNDAEFEDLVIGVCQDVLGIACKTFSPGRDGAKDSWFTGTAAYYPSTAAQWSGTFNIQAKHTKTYNASCSDNDFSVNQTSVLAKELSRLKEVIKETPFDNYLIWTNRKLTGGAHPDIVTMFQTGLGIDNVDIIGREQIDAYLNKYPHIADRFGLHKFLAPLRFFEKELKEVILMFSTESPKLANQAAQIVASFDMVTKDNKNRLNGLGKEYFDFITNHSLSYFAQIDAFLKDPKNEVYLKMYNRTISDLQAKVVMERSRFGDFMHLLEHLIDYVVHNNTSDMMAVRDIVRVFIHFMYFNCDIGKSK